MEQVPVEDFEAHIADYVERVRLGETIVVCDKDAPIGRLAPVDGQGAGASGRMVVTLPTEPFEEWLALGPVPLLQPTDVIQVLLDLRDES